MYCCRSISMLLSYLLQVDDNVSYKELGGFGKLGN
jgi:hypothetical protein